MPASAPLIEDALGHALVYAAAGLRVLPIKPGAKYPPMNSWQHAASIDAKVITNWYRGLYQNHGVGIAMGPQPDGQWIFAVDIDEHDPNTSGSDTLTSLESIHGKLPDTVRSITGAGGAHIIYSAPPTSQVRNGILGPGIDIRGDGGQIVVAPTIHPSGIAYTWEHGYAPWEIDIAEAPDWLLQLLTHPEPYAPLTVSNPSSGDSPADRLRDTWNWHNELTAQGWQHHHTDRRTGDTHWTSPHKDLRDGSSAVLHEPDGPLNIFTTHPSAQDMWRNGTPSQNNTCVAVTPFVYYAAYNHNGDLAAAAKTLNGPRGQLDTINILTTPTAADHNPDSDLLAMLIDWPDFWTVDHNAEDWLIEPLIAAGRSHALFAPGGTGKSLLSLWLATAAATGNIALGNTPQPATRVLYLDYEMTAADLSERLDAMGYDRHTDLTNLHYALLPSLPGLDEPDGGKAVVRLAQLVDAQLVIIDTFGRAVHGDENDADTVRAWYRWTGIHLKHDGRAFIRVDHAGKDLERGQRGTSAKNDDVDIVWQLIKQDDNTFTVKAKKRRMGWVPETTKLAIHADPLRFTLVDGITYPAGTAEAARLLEQLGVPATASRRTAIEKLREAGHGTRTQVIGAAQKYRRENLSRFAPTGQHPAVQAVIDAAPYGPKTSGNHLGNHSPNTLPEPAAEPPTDETTKPQHNTPGNQHGNHPEPPPAATGNHRVPPKGDPVPSGRQPLPGDDLI